jgi:predicted  nucleic acid-binding Zn-ribbon protein
VEVNDAQGQWILKGVIMMHNEKELEERIKNLEAQVKALLDGLNKLSKNSYEYDMLLNQHVKILDRQQDDAFGRIKNLEFKVFPNLAQDIKQAFDTIGDDNGKADNPLDRRKPKPKK